MSPPRPHIAAAASLALLLTGCTFSAVPTAMSSPVSSAPAPATGSGAVSVPSEEPSEEPTVDLDAKLAAALRPAAGDASLSAAVLDTESGATAAYGQRGYDTASIVKVDILATLLLQAQDAGRRLTTEEKTYATAMIEHSDNASATALWNTIGGAKGLNAGGQRLGLTGTTGGEGGEWGLTQTTARDQLTLLMAVFGTGSRAGGESPLSAASRSYLTGLMGRVEAGQQWGVSAAGSSCALKNGWLPRSATSLWDINSIGRVTANGRTYLIAVLSDGHTTMAAGISKVEDAARAAVTALAGTG
ncbi:serine hydrolase [Streptomyces sp. NPDC051320]|uniref:serine hydrolase n=1 Tax=Streptomyces sp. NPDC051320 TaxID=3154644 RepID=UPI00341A73DD